MVIINFARITINCQTISLCNNNNDHITLNQILFIYKTIKLLKIENCHWKGNLTNVSFFQTQ